MCYNEKFVYYSYSPGFYAIYFLGKKLFWCYMMYSWDVKIPGKEKKNYCEEHKFSPMFIGLFILFIKATTSPLVTLLPTLPSTTTSTPSIARNFTHRFTHRDPIISLPVTLRTSNAESEKIATVEVKYRTSRTNFTHRIA